jgi:diadenosine tetraphosphatase ApaH/serine/threonine PP2A family protein phosphatase
MDSYASDRTFELLKTKVCFVGHSHIPGVFIKDKYNRIYYHSENTIIVGKDEQCIFNVGSVGQPRDDNPDAVYCVYDTDGQKVEFKRIKYDIQAARKKIIDAGLPKFLGDRLLLGR